MSTANKQHVYMFEPNSAQMSSQRVAPGGAVVVGFNLAPSTWETDADGKVQIEEGDYVYFERVLYDKVYDVDCSLEIDEGGVIASTPLLDECGCLVKLDACNNTIELPSPGAFRAYYVGQNRVDATVVFYPKETK